MSDLPVVLYSSFLVFMVLGVGFLWASEWWGKKMEDVGVLFMCLSIAAWFISIVSASVEGS